MGRFLHIQIYDETETEIEYDNEFDTNWGILAGSCSLESMIMENELQFGEYYASMFETTLFGLDVDLRGRKIVVSLDYTYNTYSAIINHEENILINDKNEHIVASPSEIQTSKTLFTGYVNISKTDNIRKDRTIVAYDRAYTDRYINIADWWNTYWSNTTYVTLANFRNALLNYVGINYVPKSLINDNFVISNSFFEDITSLNLQDILRMICTLQVCCPHINGDGNLEFITINNNVVHDITNNTEGINSVWEDFTTEKITGIAVYDTSSELAQLVGTSENAYKIPGNIFLLNQNSTTIQSVCTNILNAIKDIQYTPAQLNLILSQPDFNLGDEIITNNGICYILNNNMWGSLLLNQSIYSPALNSKLQGEVTDINDTIINAGKYSKLTHDIDSLTSEIYDPNTGILSLIQQNSNQIVLKVDSNGNIGYTRLGADPNTNLTSFEIAADTLKFKANKTLDITTSQLTMTSTYLDINKYGEITCKSSNGTYKTRLQSGGIDLFYNENSTDSYAGRLRSENWTGSATGSNKKGCGLHVGNGGSYLALGVLNSSGHGDTEILINNGLNPDGVTQKIQFFDNINMLNYKLYLDTAATEYVWGTTYTFDDTAYKAVGCYPNLYTPGKAFINGDIYVKGKFLSELSFIQSSTITNAYTVNWVMGNNDWARMAGFATSANNGFFSIDTGDDGTEPIYVRQCTGTRQSPTVVRTLTLLDSSGNTSIPGSLTIGSNTIKTIKAGTVIKTVTTATSQNIWTQSELNTLLGINVTKENSVIYACNGDYSANSVDIVAVHWNGTNVAARFSSAPAAQAFRINYIIIVF